MSDPSIYISNGTCYIAPGVEASSEFIPCGNDFYGHVSCCQRGDNCLGSHACYNIEYEVTYLSGCSDPNYQDESCPDKGAFGDTPWTGLVYCNGTSYSWFQCSQEAQETTITSPDPCWCPSTTHAVAFTDNSILENIASLPTATGETIAWASGHFPTAPTSTSASTTSTASSTSTSASSSPTVSSGPTETSASATASSTGASSTGLSTGAKAGIGVGAAAGCLLLLGVLAFLFLQRRRRQRKEAAAAELDDGEPKLDQHDSGTSGIPPGGGTPQTPATPAVSELEPRAARPWSMRSELATNDTPISLSEQMELESKRGSAVSAMTPDSTPGRQHYARPDVLTPVAELPG